MGDSEEKGGLSVSPFAIVSNYAKMLNKIGVASCIFCIIAVSFIRTRWPWLEKTLAKLPADEVSIYSLKFHLGTIAPAMAIAIAFRVVRLHDLISTVLGIRRRFDLTEILYPLALATAGPLTFSQIQKLAERRNSLMGSVFYRYASSRARSEIDPHLIDMALDQWCWYWIILEGNFVLLLCSLILLCLGQFMPAAMGLIMVLVVILILIPLRWRSCCYARSEVEAILDSVTRRTAIGEVFREL